MLYTAAWAPGVLLAVEQRGGAAGRETRDFLALVLGARFSPAGRTQW